MAKKTVRSSRSHMKKTEYPWSLIICNYGSSVCVNAFYPGKSGTLQWESTEIKVGDRITISPVSDLDLVKVEFGSMERANVARV